MRVDIRKIEYRELVRREIWLTGEYIGNISVQGNVSLNPSRWLSPDELHAIANAVKQEMK